MIKIYRAIILEFCTSIILNDHSERIVFSSGNMERNEGGVYTTRNPKEQEALEKHPLFGKMFVKEREVSEPSDHKVKPKTTTDQPNNGTDNTLKNEGGTNDSDDDSLAFASLKDLQGYLQKEHKVSFTEIRSKDAACTKADELGIKYKIGE